MHWLYRKPIHLRSRLLPNKWMVFRVPSPRPSHRHPTLPSLGRERIRRTNSRTATGPGWGHKGSTGSSGPQVLPCTLVPWHPPRGLRVAVPAGMSGLPDSVSKGRKRWFSQGKNFYQKRTSFPRTPHQADLPYTSLARVSCTHTPLYQSLARGSGDMTVIAPK